eukprot:gene3068-5238_t
MISKEHFYKEKIREAEEYVKINKLLPAKKIYLEILNEENKVQKNTRLLNFLNGKLCFCEFTLENYQETIFYSQQIIPNPIDKKIQEETLNYELLSNISLQNFHEALRNAIKLNKISKVPLETISKIYDLNSATTETLNDLLYSKGLSPSNISRKEAVSQLTKLFFKEDSKKEDFQIPTIGDAPTDLLRNQSSSGIYNQKYWVHPYGTHFFNLETHNWSKNDIPTLSTFKVVLHGNELFIVSIDLPLCYIQKIDFLTNTVFDFDSKKRVFINAKTKEIQEKVIMPDTENLVKIECKYKVEKSTFEFEPGPNFAMFSYGNSIFVFGERFIRTTLLEEFNLDENKFYSIDNPDFPFLSGHSASIWQNYSVIFGGRSLFCSNRVYYLNLQNYKIQEIVAFGEIPPKIHCHSSVVHGDKMYIHGGLTDDSEVYNELDTVFELDLKTNYWRKIAHVLPRVQNSSLVYYNGSLFRFGGYSVFTGYKNPGVSKIRVRDTMEDQSFKNLIDKKNASDIEFITNGHTIHLQKCILSVLDINEMMNLADKYDTNIWNFLLLFLYSEGRDDDLMFKSVKELKSIFELADTLNFNQLKEFCVLNLNTFRQTPTEVLDFLLEKDIFESSLIINCFSEINNRHQTDSYSSKIKKFKNQQNYLMDKKNDYDFLKKKIFELWDKKTDFDLIFIFNNNKFIKAHQSILMINSDYFSAQFNFLKQNGDNAYLNMSQFNEKFDQNEEEKNGAQILQMKFDREEEEKMFDFFDNFKLLLKFIYFKQLKNMDEFDYKKIKKLIKLSDKYLETKLKQELITRLQTKIDHSNLFEISNFSIQYHFYSQIKDCLIAHLKDSFEIDEICDNFFGLLSSNHLYSKDKKKRKLDFDED